MPNVSLQIAEETNPYIPFSFIPFKEPVLVFIQPAPEFISLLSLLWKYNSNQQKSCSKTQRGMKEICMSNNASVFLLCQLLTKQKW